MNRLAQTPPDLCTHRDEQGVIFSVSLQIVLYAREPLDALAPGATACFKRFTKRFGSQLKWHHAGSMWRAKPFSSKQVALFPTLCRKQGAHLPRYRLFSGSGFHDFAAPNFSTGGYGSFSWLQVHLPLQLVTEWQSIFSSMAEHFPFRCGTAGLSLNWNELAVDRSPDVPRFIGMLLKRYPGLNTGTPQELCDQGLPPVNWVTLLGPSAHYVRR